MELINNTKSSVPITNITVSYGDGIGPEIMEVAIRVLMEVGAKVKIDTIDIGETSYLKGNSSGISHESWDTIMQNPILLKAPITTPLGSGYKSLNVTLRRRLELFANIRPCESLHPYIVTKYPNMNIVIVRENSEDLYTGIEYRQTYDTYHGIKIITYKASEKIARYAFEYARRNNRKKVTCVTKNNIMKMTDGTFYKAFQDVAKEYSDIENDHYILDIGAAYIATEPWRFDVIVTLNLYGDVLSDIAAQMTGSIGMAGSSNIGEKYAMFEAIHGSAPSIAGQNIANPSALLHATSMMLAHINDTESANLIKNALMYTLESGMHTMDIAQNNIHTKKILTTSEFGLQVIANLGKNPDHLPKGDYINNQTLTTTDGSKTKQMKKTLIGTDIYIAQNSDVRSVVQKLSSINTDHLSLQSIISNGMTVYPSEDDINITNDNWCLRFMFNDNSTADYKYIIMLMESLHASYEIIGNQALYLFDNELGFSLGQGE